MNARGSELIVLESNLHGLPKLDKSEKHIRKIFKITNVTAKRGLDLIAGITGIITLIPIIIFVTIVKIVSNDKGPMFFVQERIGKEGKKFKMYKFRTMALNADEILFKMLAENEEMRKEYEEYKKLKNDPRITKIGKFLRKTSLDEFPQFINVIRGEMSLVGPRPYLPREKDDMQNAYDYIIEVKPGLTGLWQVSGRNESSFRERLELDIEYYYRHSFKYDIKLLIKTVFQLIKRQGAM